ncbi:GNAT family N-acetyltransferase [Aegicerativicinus sediminis]|uniref:GNAT family N-acetyltransferase n=1 Tax=Aegicerativicinus sediminis TaxID=2893202 RepID=UPI001E393767|nr:GNAT family N-acetyltransferase [Aegicerativicinus sediminis]
MIKSVFIRPIFKEDWKEIASIYKQGMETGIATFETELPSWKKWKKSHLIDISIAAQFNNKVIGFATLSPTSKRKAYKGVAEVSIYVGSEYSNRGVGKKLMEELISISEMHGFWTLQSAIFLENKASIYLHEKFGFRKIGFREKIGQRNGRWFDNILMERRSKNVNWE